MYVEYFNSGSIHLAPFKSFSVDDKKKLLNLITDDGAAMPIKFVCDDDAIRAFIKIYNAIRDGRKLVSIIYIQKGIKVEPKFNSMH